MLRHTIDAFLSSALITHIYVVVSPDDGQIDGVVPGAGVTVLRCGGATRMESIQNGLRQLGEYWSTQDWVLVHDAARPGLNAALIEKLITTIGGDAVGGLLALPVVDTVKRAGAAVVHRVAGRPVAGADPANVPLPAACATRSPPPPTPVSLPMTPVRSRRWDTRPSWSKDIPVT